MSVGNGNMCFFLCNMCLRDGKLFFVPILDLCIYFLISLLHSYKYMQSCRIRDETGLKVATNAGHNSKTGPIGDVFHL
jgi:hypothetical protein